MDHKKINGLIQKILYAVLTGLIIFKLAISYMQTNQMVPSLLPFKLVCAYVIVLIAIVILWYGCIKKKNYKPVLTVSERFKITNYNNFNHIFVYMCLFLEFIVYNLLEYIFIKSSDMVQGMALVNIVKRTGISVNNMTVMLAYYGDELTGIKAPGLLAYVLPLLQLVLMVWILYVITSQIAILNHEKKTFVRAMLLSGIVCTLVFSVTVSYDKIWICLLAASFLYLFNCQDRYAGMLTGYSVVMWLLSGFFKLNTVLILPIVPVVSLGLTKMYVSMCGQKKETISKIFYPVLFILMLEGVYENFYITRSPDVDEMIPGEYKEILECLPDMETTKILASDDLLWYIRAKSKDVELLYEAAYMNSALSGYYYDAAVCAVHKDMQEPTGKLGNIVRTMKGNGCNYLILPLKADERWAMEQNGYSVKYENEDYVLYEDIDWGQEEI